MPRPLVASGLPASEPFPASARDTGRQVFDTALNDVCTIQRKSVAPDGGGGQIESWPNLAVGVPCRIAPLEGGERHMPGSRSDVGDRPVDESTHQVTFKAGQEIEEADRIVLDGQTYEVTLVHKAGGWEVTRRAEVKEAP